MKIEVAKIYQSPCTPVQDVCYLVKVYDIDEELFGKTPMLKELEYLSNPFKDEFLIHK